MDERVLHVCLRTPFEGQPALAAALKSIGTDYAELDWLNDPQRASKLTNLAASFKPTIVFMQLQNAEAFSRADIRAVRSIVPPECVLIQWDGDLRGEPSSADRKWFVDLGKLLDVSLVTNTEHPPLYAALGVQGADYFQIGIDPALYRPSEPFAGTPDVILLASKYKTHARRNNLVEALCQRYGNRFRVYGAGWGDLPQSRPMADQSQEAGLYAAAKCALSASIRNDLPHYTSDRLFRALASGAVTLVERFPGMEDMGLVNGQNSFSWSGGGDLFPLIDSILDELPNEKEIRQNAAALGRTQHSWAARMPELVQIIAEARARRAAA